MYGDISIKKIEKQFGVCKRYFERFLPKDKKARILDVGCGNGGFVYWLQKHGYSNAEGADISEEQVELSKKLGVENIHLSDITDFLRNKEHIYDLIFARDLLEHFTKDELLDIIELIYKSLNTGGIFVAQTINAENLLWGRLRHGDFTHELAFTKDSIRQLLKVCGFTNIKVCPQRPVIRGLKSLIRYLLWMLFEIMLRIFLTIEIGMPKGIFTQNIIVYAKKDENTNKKTL